MLPETHETIEFDSSGTCNVCNQHKFKKQEIDWEKKKEDFNKILKEYRGRNTYDCIVPFSGGKDSVYTLWRLVKTFKLKCLVVSFDHGFFRPKLIENRNKILKKLDTDSIVFTPNWKVVKKLMLESFLRKGDFCWHCHAGIFAYPMQVAVKKKIPLVIWGEPQAEYNAYYTYEDTLNENEEVDEKRFNRFINLGITAEDMAGMIGSKDVSLKDLEPFIYPKLDELKKINYRSICLGSYIPWDVKKQVEIIKKELDWEEDLNAGIPPQYSYEKVECQVQGIRDYIKYIKRGYGRTAHLVALDVRNGRLTKDEGERLIENFDGKRPENLDYFLKILELTEDEFFDIASSHEVAPHKFDRKKNIEIGPRLHDRDRWSTPSSLDREYTIQKLNEHGYQIKK